MKTAHVRISLSSLPRIHPDLTELNDGPPPQDPVSMLLRMTALVAGERRLSQTLRRIIEVVQELIGARYAALGIAGDHGHVEEFLQVGMDFDTAGCVAELPQSRGILEWLVGQPFPVRLTDVRGHPAAGCFPKSHPAMGSFLGVPIGIRGEAFGSLYLAESISAAFTQEDEQLVVGLAAAAGTAIENARLYQDAQRRQRWSGAAAELTQELALGSKNPLDIVLHRAALAADADMASLVVPLDGALIKLHAAVGVLDDVVAGTTFARAGNPAAAVMASGKAVLLETPPAQVLGITAAPLGPIVMVPLLTKDRVLGALVFGRLVDRAPFVQDDVETLTEFAHYAGIALELDRARADRETLRVHADRGRIATDLHQHVIQQLFTVGMGLEGIVDALADPDLRGRISGYVTVLDESVRRIRDTIYQVQDDQHNNGRAREH